jgi:hypothetical protein
MRKITIAIISLFMVLSFTAMASAAESHNSTAGATVTITSSGGTTCPGPNFTFDPSPSTLMSVFTSATNFTIIAASSKTNTTTGIEYGLDSDTSVVYQKTQATAGHVTSTTSANALPSGFKDKAGNTAPTS